MKIVTTTQMKAAEEEGARSGLTPEILMENAGREIAREVWKILGESAGSTSLFLIGPGNNGGDGLIAARHLQQLGVTIELYLVGRRPERDRHLTVTLDGGIAYYLAAEDTGGNTLEKLLTRTDVVIDAVLGTGRKRALAGDFASVFEIVNRAKKNRPEIKIIAVDIPTGLDADSGAVDVASPVADNTITLGLPKVGLFNEPACRWAGKINVADIGIPDEAVVDFTGEYLDLKGMKKLLPPRSSFSNKGTFGRALIVAGSRNYIGAAALAAGAVIRTGTGLATLATAGSLVPALAAHLMETTFLPLKEQEAGLIGLDSIDIVLNELDNYDAILIGPGMGQGEGTRRFLTGLFDGLAPSRLKKILDADALNTLARTNDWWRNLPYDAILTPHPGEMSRLTGRSIEAIQRDRLGTTRETAQKWRKTVVLKGAYTVVAAPDGRLAVSPFANAGLATAGTGDVLAGIISGLAAQGLSLFDAACLGVFLHGLTGEKVKERMGDAGMLASDLLGSIPLVIKKIKEVNQ